jgi:hypothetical protein
VRLSGATTRAEVPVHPRGQSGMSVAVHGVQQTPAAEQRKGFTVNNVIYIVGLVVVVAAVLSWLGLH